MADVAHKTEQLTFILLQTQLANIADQGYKLSEKAPADTTVNDSMAAGDQSSILN